MTLPDRLRESLAREIRFEPGYDKRAEKNGGVHGLQIRFLLRGERGVVQFLMYTDWIPGSVGLMNDRTGFIAETKRKLADMFPMAADLGYHSPLPKYDGQEAMKKCDILPAGTCYYGGSGLNAEPVMMALIEKGHEAAWKLLEDFYRSIFDGGA